MIHTYFRREFREININVIYKIVEACEEQFKESPGCEESVSSACRGTPFLTLRDPKQDAAHLDAQLGKLRLRGQDSHLQGRDKGSIRSEQALQAQEQEKQKQLDPSSHYQDETQEGSDRCESIVAGICE